MKGSNLTLLHSMEEAVRTLLQNPDSLEGPKVDPLDLMKAYKDKLLEEMWKQQDSLEAPPAPAHRPAPPQPASGAPEEEKEPNDSRPLVERLRALECPLGRCRIAFGLGACLPVQGSKVPPPWSAAPLEEAFSRRSRSLCKILLNV
ncbi:unnamed protein product [Arctogadus glacialis]